MKVITDSTDFIIQSQCKHSPEIFFEKNVDVYSDEDWIKAGKPFMWHLEYDKDGIRIWADAAYGFIRMQVNNECSVGRDMVSLGEYVCFGSYYETYISKCYTPFKMCPPDEEVEQDELLEEKKEENNDDLGVV